MNPVKPRHPVTWPGACARIRGLLGLEAAAAINKSDSLVAKMGDPDRDEIPNVEQALRLDVAYRLAGGTTAPLFEVYRKQLADATADLPHQAQPPATRLLTVMSEVGELSTDLAAALEDRHLKPGEAIKIQKDIADTIEKLTKLAHDVDALASGKVSEGSRE